MTELGFALIGCGGMGRSEAKVLGQVPEAKLVAVCDVAPAAAEAFGQEMGVPAYTDLAEVLGRPDVGAVIVATPNALHTQVVLDAAAAGKHIFCEKPMAITTAECDRMIAAARDRGVRLMVGHVLRLLPVFTDVVAMFDSGKFGRPVAAQINRLGWFGTPKAQYRYRKDTVGGLIYDVSIHEVDLLRRLCGPLQSVFAVMDRSVVPNIDYEDNLQLQFRFRSGAMATLFESLASAFSSFTGTIIGERGTVQFDYGAKRITHAVQGEKPVTQTIEGGENGYLRELRSFTDWVLHDKTPLLTHREGRAAIAAAQAAYRSAQTGEPVEVVEE